MYLCLCKKSESTDNYVDTIRLLLITLEYPNNTPNILDLYTFEESHYGLYLICEFNTELIQLKRTSLGAM